MVTLTLYGLTGLVVLQAQFPEPDLPITAKNEAKPKDTISLQNTLLSATTIIPKWYMD